MKTTASIIVGQFNDGINSMSRTRSILNSIAVDAKENGLACYWQLKDGSIVCESGDGQFSEVPKDRFPA